MSASKRQLTLEACFGKRLKTEDNKSLPLTANNPTAVKSPERSTSTLPSSSEPSEFDIGVFLERKEGVRWTDEEKYEWIKHTWMPQTDFLFPRISEGNKLRTFQRKWLETYVWLAYSQKKEGGFCKACVFFGKTEGGNNAVKLGKLVNEPMSKYKKALEILNAHKNNDYHKQNMASMQNFVNIFEGKAMDIITNIDSAKKQQIDDNKKKLIPIIKTVMLCASQNISFRGHRDDGAIDNEESKDSEANQCTVEGNFRALLKFRIDAGDSALSEHLQTASKNATYISKTTQNDIIDCCGDVVTSKIVSSVQKSRFFTLIVDETTDISVSEQLTMCIRFFDVDTINVREDFLKFVKITDTTGENIARVIVNELKVLDLDIQNCRGQAYDGGANMSGKFKGVQSLILKKQPLALYYHCANHKLNLALSKSCTINSIRNAVGVISQVANFFRESAQRKNFLEQELKSLIPSNKFQTIKKMCETRWIERHSAVLNFKEIITYLPSVFQKLSSLKADSSSTAFSLQHAIQSSEFIMALIILSKILSITLPLARQLQEKEICIYQGIEFVEMVLESLKDCRENKQKFQDIFEEALKIAEDMDVELKLPRKTKKQIHRANTPAKNVEDHFRLTLWIPFLGFLIQEITHRFPKTNLETMHNLMQLIPKYFSEHSIKDIMNTAQAYEEDLKCLQELEGELCIWKHICAKQQDESGSAIDAYKHAANLPNIQILLQILAIHPVTTSTAERSFSSLRRIKTYLRSTMKEYRLNGLALVNINRNILFTAEDVLEIFARKFKRKLSLKYM